jgi:hypothetical protein
MCRRQLQVLANKTTASTFILSEVVVASNLVYSCILLLSVYCWLSGVGVLVVGRFVVGRCLRLLVVGSLLSIADG